jgi:DNA-binding XRE family transcriptional regulator/PHD/YefM family antitoxin component YafN of YafNO toxin-antitoxin module
MNEKIAKPQTLTTAGGERLVVLPEADYNRLLERLEDATDEATIVKFREKLAAGEEELLPSVLVDRMMAGENLVRLWREHRNMTSLALAEKAEISQSYLSEIETGKKDGGIRTMKKLADALNVKLDDLV